MDHGAAKALECRRTDRRTNTVIIRKTIVLGLVLGGLVASLSACNTVKGVGRDIESVGEAGSRAI
jgi:predicted small secreted protein